MGVEIETTLTLDSSWKMMGWEKLEKSLKKLFPEIAKDIQKKIALKDPGFVTRNMPIREFHSREAGLFTHAVTGGFLKRNTIDPNTSVVSVDRKNGLVNIELIMPVQQDVKEQFEKQDAQGRTGYIMKTAGGLDKTSASRMFDEAIQKSKQG